MDVGTVGGAAAPEADVAVPFADWVRDHLAVLSALAVREVGTADAPDLVQEALLRAWRRRSTFDATRGSARAWLVAILLDQARRARARRRAPVLLADEPVTETASDVDLERALGSLPRRQREVVVLHYLADLAVADVAAALSISAGTVKSTLSDARRTLRSLLEPS